MSGIGTNVDFILGEEVEAIKDKTRENFQGLEHAKVP